MKAQEIKELRKKLKFTQVEFGGILGVDVITVSRWERGEQRPRSGHIRKMERLERKML